MSEFAEAIEKLRNCERRMIAAETCATLGCNHHVSNLNRTVESGTAFCRLCDLESRCRDAEKQERELVAENARLREWVRELRELLRAAHPFVTRGVQVVNSELVGQLYPSINLSMLDDISDALAETAPKEAP